MYTAERFWAGTEESLASYIMSMRQVAAMDLSSHVKASEHDDDDENERPPRLFSRSGDVGIITISGALVNNDSWINEYVGRTGYPEIREALIYAATQADIGAIVLDINSGGGAVSGVDDTSNLIKKIDVEMKPVHTFSDSMIASAAYWLGCSARSISIGRVTEAGSIGVLTVHKEMTKMLEMEGINATVMRAGEFKALGNPYEELSPTAKAEIQKQLDYMGEMFTAHVAERRGVPYPTADRDMGQGRVFVGAQAVAVGLVDAIASFDEVVSKAQGAIDSEKNVPQYGVNFQKGNSLKTALTQQQIAAMAEAGLPVSAAASAAVGEQAQAPAVPVTAPAEAAAPAASETPEAPVTATLEQKGDSDIVAFLKTSLAEANASLLSVNMELRDVKAASADMAQTHDQLRAIASASVDRLRVALGMSAAAHTGNDTALLADHASLRAQFETQFKAGGVAAVSSSGSSDKVSAVADPVRQARLASTRPAK